MSLSLSDQALQLAPDIPRRVVTQPYDLSVETLIQQIAQGSLVLHDFYQRNYVWDNVKASKLIESLLMNVPIPVCYFSEEENTGRYLVVDGQQRLTAIYNYYRNVNRLRGLTVLPQYEGKKWDDLDRKEQRVILSRTIRCIVITHESHPSIRFEVFERLNTGSVALNDQELRNCIFRGPLNDLIKELAVYPPFLELLRKQQPDKRMRDHEQILKFFALADGYKYYKTPMKHFLNDFMRESNRVQVDTAALGNRFRRVIDDCLFVFGPSGLSKYGDIPVPNRAVMDVILIGFAQLSTDAVRQKRSTIRNCLSELLSRNDFLSLIEHTTGDRTRFHARLRLWGMVLASRGIDNPLVCIGEPLQTESED